MGEDHITGTFWAYGRVVRLLFKEQYQETENGYAGRAFVFQTAATTGEPMVGLNINTFVKQVSDGNFHYMCFEGISEELSIDERVVVSVIASCMDVEFENLKTPRITSIKLEEFLDKIGAQSVYDFFNSPERPSLKPEIGQLQPRPE